MSEKWVVFKVSEPYEGGPGYDGWTCTWTKTEPGRIYNSKEEAEEVAKTLGGYNKGATFKVTKWKKPSKNKKPKVVQKTKTTHMDDAPTPIKMKLDKKMKMLNPDEEVEEFLPEIIEDD
ncbi:hypothetical protein C4577_02935 [Candidatus Parcubacteria bacterium]|nr:MAG: hypothetical protein C4577_02935 [Candidatus Parcubacteria bacterium]